MAKDSVRAYYASFGENEWDRLTRPEGQIDHEVTARAFERHLPAGGRMIDIGGATGRWLIWLARRGYSVTLLDLSPNLLDIARVKIADAGASVAERIEAVVEGDACDLSRFPDASFDAALCLGPFYHLTEPDDRRRAARELARVLKPGGVAFVAFMPVYGYLRRTLALADEQPHLGDSAFVNALMLHGVFQNDVPGRFNGGYGIRPDQIEPFMAGHGFQKLQLLSDTGFAGPVAAQLSELAKANPEAHRAALRLILDTADDPSLLGGSTHILYVGRR